MTKWEYKVISWSYHNDVPIFSANLDNEEGMKWLNVNSREELLNNLGQEGWELIKIRGGSSDQIFYFKRPL